MSAVAKKESNTEMTTKRLIKICRKKGLYETPEYNDSLYLNYEGFSSISNLDAYINVKSLFLEGNVLSKIENINHLTHLRGLYLQSNLLKTINGLDGLNELNSLDLSNNQIHQIDNMSHLKKLETLNLANNLISCTTDLEPILDNTSLVTLDLSGNKFKTEQEGFELIKLLSNLPNLKSLYLKGNECINKMNWYRKHTIATIRTLTFLDDRPVFENERRLNDAWIRGGRQAEDEEKKKIAQEKIDKRNKTRKIRREKYEARRKAMMERIEREQKENEMKQLNGDDVSEESKANEDNDNDDRDVVALQDVDVNDGDQREISAEVSEDSKLPESEVVSAENVNEDQIEDNLPGMVNRHLNLD